MSTISICNIIGANDSYDQANNAIALFMPSNKKFIKFFNDDLINQKMIQVDVKKSLKNMLGKLPYKISKKDSKQVIGSLVMDATADMSIIEEYYLFDGSDTLIQSGDQAVATMECTPILTINLLKKYLATKETNKIMKTFKYYQQSCFNITESLDIDKVKEIGIDFDNVAIIYNAKQLKKFIKFFNVSNDVRDNLITNFIEKKSFLIIY